MVLFRRIKPSVGDMLMNALFRNITIRTKLAVLFFISIGMLFLLSIVIWDGYRSIDRERRIAYEVKMAESSLQLLLRGIGEYVLTEGSSAAREITLQGMKQSEDSIRLISGEGGDIAKKWEPIQKGTEEFLKKRRVSPTNDEDMIRFGKLSSVVGDFLGEINKIAVASSERAETTLGNVTMSVVAILALALASIAAFSFLTYMSIVPPLGNLVSTMLAVERSNDLSIRVEARGKDEAAQLARTFNALLDTLQGALRQILDSVDKVSDASHALSSSSDHVSASSHKQSEAAAAMAASVEEITVSISHISDSAHKALEISRNTGYLSSHGGTIIHNTATEITQIADTVRQISDNIEDLGRQSDQVSSIVQLIKGVAEQTNLLALNAAIEAARAGEGGRGFAVVADEVRKLAERTTKATAEIAQMISAMQGSTRTAVGSMGMAVTQVGGGVALVQQAGDAINQINSGAGQVINVVSDISAALAEQSSASNDIAAHVEKVAQMSEENSAAANRAAEAATNLEELAVAMHKTVGRFKI